MALIEMLSPLVQFIASIIAALGYGGIFLLMVFESALIPIPSEIIMPFSGFLAATGKLGLIGVICDRIFWKSCWFCRHIFSRNKAGRVFLIKYGKYIFFKPHHLVFIEELFHKYGEKIVFVGRLLPGVRTYVSLPAGIGRTNFLKFTVYTLAGSLIWNTILTYAGFQLGRNWRHIDKYSIYLDVIAVIAVISFVIWIVYKNRTKTKAISSKVRK